ncbi:NifB/NifX family molybdenum-iron cluster-binding protein [Sulfurovum sp.]|uniref:NifB/NifX family molybdenum-iron cluster-binding protein n=1 Tax=Sulfurovum sp. TaxID=1969726 RepID=UPI0025D68B9F|nr:NifB/NifX family molybdenum-iron cluster-binding protein [Sulfurovum sp.]
MFGRRNIGRGQGSERGVGNGRGRGPGRGLGTGYGNDRGLRVRDRSGRGSGFWNKIGEVQGVDYTEAKDKRKMRVAFVTNNGRTIAKHIGLAKQIAIYQFPEGALLEMVENPVMKRVKEEGIQLEKANEGERHLGVGRIIPAFLKEKGVDVFVTNDFGKGVMDNLLAMEITPVVPHSREISEVVEMLRKNQEQ